MFKPNINQRPALLGFTLTAVFLVFKYLTIFKPFTFILILTFS